MFIIGMGLSTLETVANPFLAMCGPPQYSQFRLGLAQLVETIGSLVTPLIASRVFFTDTIAKSEDLKNIRWVYISFSCLVVFFIFLFIIVPIPELTDRDMGIQGLLDLGRYTIIGNSLIVTATGGGAIFPPITGAVATKMQKIRSNRPFHRAMIVPTIGFTAAWIYPLYANIWNRKAQVLPGVMTEPKKTDSDSGSDTNAPGYIMPKPPPKPSPVPNLAGHNSEAPSPIGISEASAWASSIESAAMSSIVLSWVLVAIVL
ncbi:hypothetical protein EPUL_004003 [Erysiphe pulchra]|uniref:Major facilitator superfamily (MFS) profile domain-containing protein n=1 Tax=Erysiphe pulchra TaxID=225359 RepID=A0A2S4PWS2_9PEZI|nr:hypothetical protein EPUL_004003 [Erysiphe pulchra]